MEKRADTEFPIHALLAERWSPRAFADRAIAEHDLASLFEAARWAPSCFNEQPWRYVVASRRDDADGFARLAACLTEGNAWAKHAPVLALSVARTTFTRNGKPNRWAAHDVGLATGNLCVQAQALGLSVHQMGGFDAQCAREVLAIPEGHEPMAMIAIGYAGPADALPPELAAREVKARERRALAELVFGGGWGSAAPWA